MKAYEFAGEKNVAFMKSLPHSLYKGTSINDSYKKWLKSKIPLKIETMESVFSEIEDLVITKKYANFIAARPYIKPPPYLLECGLIKYPEGQTYIKSPKGTRRLTRKETIYTLCEGPKVERLRYSDVRLPILEAETY
ncbi:unnamed protein product [Psylliodes chrysocephalus]|uniref:Uncharacterized protein n=1 Tax=Psylliodes chrysocephalus TaxID=3402493 RepID=A0A9P0G6S0_9CUCU|nr:unnamed protein product [Psylliodes chrysocephala]